MTIQDRNARFYVLIAGVFFFFGMHNFLQEYIMSLPGYKVGVFLSFLEVLGVTVCAYGERHIVSDHSRKAPWSSYVMLCFLLFVSSGTSNLALGYINYPTKVVFRSCKLIPTMLIAMSYNKKHVYWFQFMFGAFISLGMVFFAAADFQSYPKFNSFGIILVSISVCADAFLPNFQERVFEVGATRLEITFYTNALCLLAMCVTFSMTGQLQTALMFTFATNTNLWIMGAYMIFAYVAINFHMTLVQEFGGITTVVVGNARKAMTIVLSFLFFPKPFSFLYVIGGVLVFGSLVGEDIMKERAKAEKRNSSTFTPDLIEEEEVALMPMTDVESPFVNDADKTDAISAYCPNDNTRKAEYTG